MRIGIIVGALLFLVSPVLAAFESPKVALDATDMPIEQAMSSVAKQAGVQIVCEPDLAKTVNGYFESIELDKLLDTITKTNQLKWQKLYFPAQDDQKPSLEQIKARARVLDGISGGTVGVYDPATGKQKVFVEQDPASPAVEPEKLGLKPVYFIFKPKVEKKDAETSKGSQDIAAQLQSLQNQRMKLLMEMTPEQRVAAYQQEMMYMMQLSPEARQDLMLAEIRARHDMDPSMRDQYRGMMRDTFRAMREQGLLPDRGPGGGPPFGDRGDRGGRRDRGGD